MRNNLIIFLFFVVVCLLNMSSRGPNHPEKEYASAGAAIDTLKMAEVPAVKGVPKPIEEKPVDVTSKQN